MQQQKISDVCAKEVKKVYDSLDNIILEHISDKDLDSCLSAYLALIELYAKSGFLYVNKSVLKHVTKKDKIDYRKELLKFLMEELMVNVEQLESRMTVGCGGVKNESKT